MPYTINIINQLINYNLEGKQLAKNSFDLVLKR